MVIFRGVIDDRGNVPALPVSLNLVATLTGDDGASVVVAGDVEAGPGGVFELRPGVPQDQLDPLGDSVTVVVMITPYVPGPQPVTLVFNVVPAAGQACARRSTSGSTTWR